MARPTEPNEGQSGMNRIEAGFGHGARVEHKTRFLFRIPFYQGISHTRTVGAISTTYSYMTTTARLDLGSTGVGFRHNYHRLIATNFRVMAEGDTGYALGADVYKGTTKIGSVSTTSGASATWFSLEADIANVELTNAETWSATVSTTTLIRNGWVEVEGYAWDY